MVLGKRLEVFANYSRSCKQLHRAGWHSAAGFRFKVRAELITCLKIKDDALKGDVFFRHHKTNFWAFVENGLSYRVSILYPLEVAKCLDQCL